MHLDITTLLKGSTARGDKLILVEPRAPERAEIALSSLMMMMMMAALLLFVACLAKLVVADCQCHHQEEASCKPQCSRH